MGQAIKILIVLIFFLQLLTPIELCDAASNLELQENMKYSYSYELTIGDFNASIDLFVTNSTDELYDGITVVSITSFGNLSTRMYRFKILKDEKKFYETSYLREKEIYSEDVHFTELTDDTSQSFINLIFTVAMIEQFYDFDLDNLISETSMNTNWSGGMESNISFDGEIEYNNYNVYKITASKDSELFGSSSSTYYISTVFPYTLVALYSDVGGVENYITIDLESSEEKIFNSSDYDIEFAPNRNPRCLFDYNVNNGIVEFDASDSYDEDGEIVSYLWNFGDGSNDLGMTTSHEYDEDGRYTVKLYVTDDEGGEGFSLEFIDIELSPGEEGDTEDTPGFELLFLISAIALFFILKKKRN